ncbi:neuromedin-U receptor 1-like isoform X2 [Pectinophora gossypiella]|uniref:neuromedin-U receptor 1-like isoform X2 n=1 Tax=Pectinophora gossypiella TaxID=13191 RepID=UPI00214E95FB|nr:neuromedin-U receptor 1-like isoform X2 [Pectinophora gossypiella]
MSNQTEILEEFTVVLWSQLLQEALKEESRWALIVFITSMFIIFIVSIIGNLLSCIVIYYDRTMHTATNYYLLNLAVSDLIVTFAILLEIHEHLSDAYTFGSLACKIHFFLIVLLWNSSILTMTALAIERYIAIWHPLVLKSTPVWRRVMKILVLIWVMAIAASLPEVWTVCLVKTQKSSVCFIVPTKFARILNGVLALVMFVLPLGIMMFVYGMIAVKVSLMEKTTKRNKIFNHRDNRSKVNKLIALTLSFVVCWLPFFSLRVLFFVCNIRQLMRLPQWVGAVYKVVSFNSWFGVVLNPVLFSLKSTKFRKALKALWAAKFKKKHQQLPKSTTVISAGY